MDLTDKQYSSQDGVPLSKTDRISMRQALDGTVTLRVLDVKKEDLGRYKVRF